MVTDEFATFYTKEKFTTDWIGITIIWAGDITNPLGMPLSLLQKVRIIQGLGFNLGVDWATLAEDEGYDAVIAKMREVETTPRPNSFYPF